MNREDFTKGDAADLANGSGWAQLSRAKVPYHLEGGALWRAYGVATSGYTPR